MRVRVGDVRLYFDVVGMGLEPQGPVMRQRPTILCLHGGPGFDHSSLKPYLAPLADVAQVVFLDHRGQGRSDESTPDSWNLETWIEDVRAFCETLEITSPVILGQSFGGMVALGVAIRNPELPSKLIVSSSTATMHLDRAYAMFERLGGSNAREVAERFFGAPDHESFEAFMATCIPLYNPSPSDPDVRARAVMRPEVGFHFFSDEIKRYSWLDELHRIQCPTLILAGELDPITPVLDHEELAAAMPGSRLETFAEAGHGVFRDKPEEALAVIREFVLG